MFLLKTIFFILIVFSLNSCQFFSKKQQAHIDSPEDFIRLENKEIVKDKSFNAQYLNDDAILFLKNQTIDHDETQIYLKTKNHEKILTHLKGHNFIHKPAFNEEEFLFLSDNESEKFNLNRIQKSLENKVKHKATKKNKSFYIPILPKDMLLFNFDIYKRQINDFKQSRITKKLTPDLWSTSDGKYIYFSRMYKKYLQIYGLNPKNNQAQLITKDVSHHTLLNTQGNITAWVEFNTNWSSSKLVIAKAFNKQPTLKFDLGIVQSIDIHPNENIILISSNYQSKQFELFAVDLDKLCITRLSYLKSNEYWPSWHPSGQKFIYTSDISGTLQIYESQFFKANSCTALTNSL